MSKFQQSIEELLIDDSFLRWLNGKASVSEKRRWENWVSEDPARVQKVRKAQELYRSLSFEEELPQTISDLNRLRRAIKSESTQQRKLKYNGSKRSSSNYWFSAVAVVLLLVVGLVGMQTIGWESSSNEKDKETVYRTATTEYGQIRRLTLWDGSKVVLNANSKLTYPETYTGGNLKVTLEGEAYFSIVHKSGADSREFIVQTSEGLVTVLGTKFNVNTRSEETAVVLEEGKVHLEVADTLSAVKSNYYYTMKPGERALLSPHRKGIDVQSADPELYTSWRNLELKFDNTPLEQIARQISQTYGAKINFKDKNLKNVEFSGTVTNKNFAVLLQGLRTLLNVPITHHDNTITFGK